MTDPETADVTYIEPLNVERLTQIIEKERPDALLPNLGGQSALNLCSELSNAGVLDKYNVQVLGVKVDAIERGEDRLEFKKAMNELGIEMARSEIANTVDEALAIAKYAPKASSEIIEKLLKSAIANAENNHGMKSNKLYVAEIYANQGPTLRRIRPAAKGSAVRIRKRTSHITIILREREA